MSENRDRQVMTATRLQLINEVERFLREDYGSFALPMKRLRQRLLALEIKLPDTMIKAKKGERAETDTAQYCRHCADEKCSFAGKESWADKIRQCPEGSSFKSMYEGTDLGPGWGQR